MSDEIDVRKHPQGSLVSHHKQRLPGTYLDQPVPVETELRDEIQALKDRIAELESKQDANPEENIPENPPEADPVANALTSVPENPTA